MTLLSAAAPIRSAPVLRIKVRTSTQHGGRFGTANAILPRTLHSRLDKGLGRGARKAPSCASGQAASPILLQWRGRQRFGLAGARALEPRGLLGLPAFFPSLAARVTGGCHWPLVDTAALWVQFRTEALSGGIQKWSRTLQTPARYCCPLPETAERIDQFIDVAAQRRLNCLIKQFSQAVGDGIDGEPSLKPDADREMSPPRLRRCGLTPHRVQR